MEAQSRPANRAPAPSASALAQAAHRPLSGSWLARCGARPTEDRTLRVPSGRIGLAPGEAPLERSTMSITVWPPRATRMQRAMRIARHPLQALLWAGWHISWDAEDGVCVHVNDSAWHGLRRLVLRGLAARRSRRLRSWGGSTWRVAREKECQNFSVDDGTLVDDELRLLAG